jgi:hypothetical protein
MVDGHIDGYKIEKVLRGGFFRVKAPVFSHPFVTLQALYVIVVVFCVATVFTVFHKTNIMPVDGNIVAQSSAIFTYFGALSSFLFGFYVFDTLTSYNSVKNTAVGGFWGNFSVLMVHTSTWFPGTDEKTKLFKETILRWGMASFSLTCGMGDPECSDEESVASCEARGLLTQDEAEIVRKHGSRAVTPLVWMLDSYEVNMSATAGGGGHPDFKVNKAENCILAMRAGVTGVSSATTSWGQTPLPLVHLMSGLVKLQLILLGISEGVHAADIICGETSSKLPQLVFILVMAISTPLIFQGLLEFVIMIGNPFGRDWVDFPTSLWYKEIRDEMQQYITIGETAVELSTVKAVKGLKHNKK